jgi:hypothetical protein
MADNLAYRAIIPRYCVRVHGYVPFIPTRPDVHWLTIKQEPIRRGPKRRKHTLVIQPIDPIGVDDLFAHQTGQFGSSRDSNDGGGRHGQGQGRLELLDETLMQNVPVIPPGMSEPSGTSASPGDRPEIIMGHTTDAWMSFWSGLGLDGIEQDYLSDLSNQVVSKNKRILRRLIVEM